MSKPTGKWAQANSKPLPNTGGGSGVLILLANRALYEPSGPAAHAVPTSS